MERWSRAKEKIGFEKRKSGFDDLEKDDGGPENHDANARGLQ